MKVWELVGLACGLALAGCQSKPIEQMSYTELNQLAGVLAKSCLDQGVKAGSAEMDLCLRQEVGREKATRAANAQKRQALAGAMAAAGQNMQQNAAASQPITCNSSAYGRNVQTTCY